MVYRDVVSLVVSSVVSLVDASGNVSKFCLLGFRESDREGMTRDEKCFLTAFQPMALARGKKETESVFLSV